MSLCGTAVRVGFTDLEVHLVAEEVALRHKRQVEDFPDDGGRRRRRSGGDQVDRLSVYQHRGATANERRQHGVEVGRDECDDGQERQQDDVDDDGQRTSVTLSPDDQLPSHRRRRSAATAAAALAV